MPVGGFIIGTSIAVIAISVSVILVVAMAVPMTIAVVSGLSTLAVLTALQVSLSFNRVRKSVGNQITDLRETVGHTLRQIGTLTERVDQAHSELSDRIDQDGAQLNAEISLVEAAVRELADTVDGMSKAQEAVNSFSQPQHERSAELQKPTLTSVSAQAPESRAALDALAHGVAPQPESAVESPLVEQGPVEANGAASETAERDALIQRLADSALADDRAEMCLQPIVKLPQRKVVYYDAVTRLKSRDGGALWPSQFSDALENTGGIKEIDMIAVPRAIAVVRRLIERGRDVSIFVAVSMQSISDSETFKVISDAISAEKDIAQRVILSFSQSGFDLMGPLEDETLLALRDQGVRLALHGVHDLRFDHHTLNKRGIRFVRIDADTILSKADTIPSDIHPADLGGLLMRTGIRLIASDIREERTVPDVLDYDVELAQGDLFSPPRPVRSDILANLTAPTQIAAAG
ncbi:MAG: EAL domain-containing protein [Pseudomonadota bacterium]